MTDTTNLDTLIAAVEDGNSDAFEKAAWEMCLARWHAKEPYFDNTEAEKAYHGSLDAALALHEALLPHHKVATLNQTDVSDTHYNAKGKWSVRLWDGGDSGWADASGADTPARAWLLAILKAYRAQASA